MTPWNSPAAFRASLLAWAGLALAGCGVKSPPDPNDPGVVNILQPDVLQRNLKWASEMVNDRVGRQEISEPEGKKLLAKYADELVAKVDFKHMNEAQAWQYAEIFLTAERWELAKKALELAVAHAQKTKNQDRRVNDSLRLARALAQCGEPDKAISTARSVFDARDEDKAPILLAILYEIAPAIKGHGRDLLLAKLLEDAIDQHNRVVVDTSTYAGRNFMAARPHHMRTAWQLAVDLYRSAGRADLADAARQKMDAMLSDQGRL